MTPPSSAVAPADEGFAVALAWATSEATGILLQSEMGARFHRTRRVRLEQVKSIDIETDLDLGRDPLSKGLA